MRIIGALLVGALLIGAPFLGIEYYRLYKPRQQAAEREVWQETPSYVNGKIEQLGKMKREYETSDDPVARKAIRNEALNAALTVDRDTLPPALRGWLTQMENSR